MNSTGQQRSAEQSPTPVVTAFLWDGQRILLARRSGQVSTFPGHWAGISGYLEGDDPATWALVEIEEETGILRDQVTLRCAGETLRADDEASGRRFLVHPFLFSVPTGIGVRRDWEAAQLQWIAVDDLLHRKKEPMVPRLLDAFAAVWPPWDAAKAMRHDSELACRVLKADRSMGAGTLARTAGAEVIKLADVFADKPFSALRDVLVTIIGDLARVRPSMASPRNLMDDFRDALLKARDATDFRLQAERLVHQSLEAESTLAEKVARRVTDGLCVMTISYSSTVLRALSAAADRLCKVIVCESRPLCEGRQLAASLRESGVWVTLITEAQVLAGIDQADLVFLGADCVIPGRGVINKIGSGLLALAAHETGKPVLVAAESLKWVRDPSQFSIELEKGSAEEVWSDAPTGLEVVNVYFELVPESWITETIHE